MRQTLGVLCDDRACAAGADDDCFGRIAGFELRHQAVAQRGAAIDEARSDAVGRVAAEQFGRLAQFDLGQQRRARGERFERDLEAGRDDTAEILRFVRDEIDGDRGAEVGDDPVPFELRSRGECADQPILSHLLRVHVFVDERHLEILADEADRNVVDRSQ